MRKLLVTLFVTFVTFAAIAETEYLGEAKTFEQQYERGIPSIFVGSKLLSQDYYNISNCWIGNLNYVTYNCKTEADKTAVLNKFNSMFKLVHVLLDNTDLNAEVAVITKKYGCSITYSNGFIILNMKTDKGYATFFFM